MYSTLRTKPSSSLIKPKKDLTLYSVLNSGISNIAFFNSQGRYHLPLVSAVCLENTFYNLNLKYEFTTKIIILFIIIVPPDSRIATPRADKARQPLCCRDKKANKPDEEKKINKIRQNQPSTL